MPITPAGLLAIAEETLAEFLSKATGTAVNWVQIIGMKPGPDSIGIVAVSCDCSGVAVRACGLVSLEPTKIFERDGKELTGDPDATVQKKKKRMSKHQSKKQHLRRRRKVQRKGIVLGVPPTNMPAK